MVDKACCGEDERIGSLETTASGRKFVLTIVCLTKCLISLRMPDKSAKTVAKALFNGFVLNYGVMKCLRTDQGTEFKNEVLKELAELLGVAISTTYHHESLGKAERSHRTLYEYLRSYLKDSRRVLEIFLVLL